ncbi:MAG: hypothetical protein KIT11_09745 [Fimbriimonadaceae bacterium]|nr:hypothetical protein [Fimbriimonadaceae bacterium]QYK55607.1 MAG: hypothetical protein KF733_11415 [Fimbriimonadaceae bacterium]
MRWQTWLEPLIALLLALHVYLQQSQSPSLLQDSDTREILRVTSNRPPLYWFLHDWPLENHFYRPVSTLTFELDRRIDPGTGEAFARTNAVSAAVAVFLVYLVTSLITTQRNVGLFATGVFTFWLSPLDLSLLQNWGGSLAVAVAIGLIGRGTSLLKSFKWAGATLFVVLMTMPEANLYQGVVNWIPGRTASLATVMALGALAIVLTGARKESPVIVWSLLTFLCSLLALLCYEQAVAIPIVCALWISASKGTTLMKRGLVLGGLLSLAVYIFARLAFVPTAISTYQGQQLRSVEGTVRNILDTLVPGFTESNRIAATLDLLPSLLLTGQWWISLAAMLAPFAGLALIAEQRGLKEAGAFYLAFVVTFLPVAFLKFFDHYYFMPLAFKAMFVAWFGLLLWRSVVNEWKRPRVAAPLRFRPAPGSLQRP